jgi:hypothetical protein
MRVLARTLMNQLVNPTDKPVSSYLNHQNFYFLILQASDLQECLLMLLAFWNLINECP